MRPSVAGKYSPDAFPTRRLPPISRRVGELQVAAASLHRMGEPRERRSAGDLRLEEPIPRELVDLHVFAG